MKHYLHFSNIIIFMYILFFTAIIFKHLATTTETYIEPMSLNETVDADKLRTSLLSGKVKAFQPKFDEFSQNVNDNTSNIKTTMDTITTVLKQKVNNVNQRVGKDITDKDNAPAPITGTS
jgi:LPS O-antigen subunit length determinant protein (WzzB/FepE family)